MCNNQAVYFGRIQRYDRREVANFPFCKACTETANEVGYGYHRQFFSERHAQEGEKCQAEENAYFGPGFKKSEVYEQPS